MPKPRNSRSERPRPSAKRPAGATPSIASQTLIPLGAVLLSGSLGADLIRLQCYEGLDVTTALYEWNYPRQLLHIKLGE